MTNRPKGKLFALLAIFAAIGLVTATGAFTSVQADRQVTVTTAGDGSALLSFDDSVSSYATISGNELQLDFGSSNGVNINATTDFGAVFKVTNNGDSSVGFFIADESGELQADDTAPSDFINNDDLRFYNQSSGSSIEGSGNHLNIGVGNSATVYVEITVPDGASTGTYLSGSIVIYADTGI